jgi:hypothetical protein
MSALELACPLCGRLLKLPDHRMLGRQGRCGQCGHQFVMERPVGGAVQVEFATIDDLSSAPRLPVIAEESRMRTTQASSEWVGIDLAAVEADQSLARYKRKRQKTSGRGAAGWIALLGLLALLAAGIVWWLLSEASSAKSSIGERSAVNTQTGVQAAAAGPHDARGASLSLQTTRIDTAQQLSLQHLPSGARILIHLRPTAFWDAGGPGDEFRQCLGPLGAWIEGEIHARCLLPPSQIDEVLFALVPVGREAFATAGVVRAREAIPQSDLIAKFQGELVAEPAIHYVGRTHAYLIADARTFAFAPRDMAPLLADSDRASGITSDGIQSLLHQIDRRRDFLLLCELDDVRLGANGLVPQHAHDLLQGVLEFLGDDVDAVCWGFRLGTPESDLMSELLVRHRSTKNSARVLHDLQTRIAALPERLLEMVRRAPPSAPGEKKIVGRLPVMTKVVEQSLTFGTDRRLISFAVRLPERAGPNLALGARLAWQQSTAPVADITGAPARDNAQPGSPPAKASIARRLKRRFDVEFRDEPLSTAIEFIGSETDVSFRFDGPGMKLAGVTQNEKQKFAMSGAPALAILDRILTPRGLVLIVDEAKQTATITSAKAAQATGLIPFPLMAETGD